MTPTNPSTISRSGFKYWLEPDGTLYHTDEHSLGARRWAMQNLDDAPMTFGVKDLFKRGWIRMVTERDTIWVSGGDSANNPELNTAQKRTVREVSDRFLNLNGKAPVVKVGDKSPTVVDTGTPEFVKKAELDSIPTSYKKRGVALLGDSIIKKFVSLFDSK